MKALVLERNRTISKKSERAQPYSQIKSQCKPKSLQLHSVPLSRSMNLSFLKGIPIPDKSTHDLKSIHLRQYMSHPGYHLSLRDMVQYDYELALFLIKGFFNPRLHHLLISILFALIGIFMLSVPSCIRQKSGIKDGN